MMVGKIFVAVAVAVVCATAFTWEPAEAQVRWYGFSDLRFEAEWRGGPCKDCVLTVNIVDFKVQTRCYNAQGGEFCQKGQGNAGDISVEVEADCETCTKAKGLITATGAIDLSVYDDHSHADHHHTCIPSTNPNKIEHLGSAHVTDIKVEWTLTDGDGKLVREGFQECYWPGTFDETTCTPVDPPPELDPDGKGTEFICPVNADVAIKGKK